MNDSQTDPMRADRPDPTGAAIQHRHDVAAEIDRLATIIVSQFAPERVILFGSQARGDARPDSDADFLVVLEVPDSHRRTAQAIRRALRDRMIPVDIVVVTPTEFARRRDAVGTVVRPAVREGRTLYARAA